MVQAKDIADEAILNLLDGERWSFTSDIQTSLDEFPPKVVLAKLRSLKRRGLVDGCDCGCRGDWIRT